LFGARALARDLQGEVANLRAELDRLAELGVLSVAELEQRRDALQREVDANEVTLAQEREEATAALARERADAESSLRNDLSEATDQRDNLLAELTSLRGQVVVTREEAVLQEVGIYEYRHPLSDAVAYKADLARLKDKIKTMGRKDGGAVLAATDWTVNGSSSQGRAMVGNYSKLILRAYNAEADNLVRGLKPYKLDSSVDRLTKVTSTIEKLGKTMNIRISEDYHDLRVRELEMTADYLEKLAEEKEREREDKERLREERKAQQEMERERARLEKERQHYENAMSALVAKGDKEGAARLREQVSDIDRRIEDVDYRAANIRAGYVYVISNVGTFGDQVIKVGLTRRLEPRDRVRELGDASVPFRFDIHALFFSDDAVGIEHALHERLADRRVNRVNLRREFFYATPQEVREHLRDLKGDLLEFDEVPEALEYHQSVTQTALSTPGLP
jgi:exonuclease VII large subunit